MKLRIPGSRLLWVLVTLFLLLLIATPLIWSWSATREWQRVKAAIEAEGETFDLQKLLPPPPPDDDNFCAIPALKDIAQGKGGWTLSQASAFASAITLPRWDESTTLRNDGPLEGTACDLNA